jgi:5-methylthioadenosine/S-adenosylhomocysteine deaminase
VPPNELPHPQDARRVRDQYFSSDDQLVTMALAVRGPHYTVKEVCVHDWKLARELGLRISVHVGDGELGRDGAIRWLAADGLLGDDTTYVHCNTLADDELRLIADSGGTASVAADVEMQMGHGFPATGRLLDVGMRPSLSIDVCTSTGGSMFSLMRTALGMQRALDNKAADEAGLTLGGEPPRVTCRDMLEFATIEGARACGLDHRIGSLTPGKQADVVVIRADSVGMIPVNNPVASLIYNAHIGLIDTVVVAGRVVKAGGVLVGERAQRARRLAEHTREYLLAEALKDPRISDIALGGAWMPELEPTT